jgi:cell wall assembly regulator SMI1
MQLQKALQQILAKLSSQGYDTRTLVFGPPATEAELTQLETDLGHALPASLREVLASMSAHVEFRWFAPPGNQYIEPFHQNFSGEMHWSLSLLRQFAKDKQQWIETVFKNPADEYDRVWHNKLAFHEVGNGDYLAIDLSESKRGRVVYLSHDDGEGHGYELAESFADFLDRFVSVACAGAEDWQWLPFTNGGTTRIDPTCSNARKWREVLALDV